VVATRLCFATRNGRGRERERGCEVNVIFDLDGTLTDPGVGITGCIQHALVAMGHRAPDAHELRHFIGPPLREAFATLLQTADEARLQAAIGHYRRRFEAVGMFENVVYPGIPEALRALQERGHQLWVATSKPERYARQIVEHFGLTKHFRR